MCGNKKVVIVECDLKKPSILSYFMEPYNDYALFDVINVPITKYGRQIAGL